MTVFAGGSGSLIDPYLIVTAAQLDRIRDNPAANYQLAANIVLEGDWVPIPVLSGNLDGRGLEISGLQVASLGQFMGFISSLEAKVSNLVLSTTTTGVLSDAAYYAGVLAGQQGLGGVAENVVVRGNLDAGGRRGGGMFGYSLPGAPSPMAIDCLVLVAIRNRGGFTGGIAANGPPSKNCYFCSEIAGTTTSGSSGGTDLPLSSIPLASSYPNWDFTYVWEIRDDAPALMVRPPSAVSVTYTLPEATATATVDCAVTVEDAPVSRAVIALSATKVAVSTPLGPRAQPVVVGYGFTDDSGLLSLDLDGYEGEVYLLALDDWATVWAADHSYAVGDLLRPTVFSGVTYECTVAGVSGASAPDWWPYDENANAGEVGTATFKARLYRRPLAHGPIYPTVIAS